MTWIIFFGGDRKIHAGHNYGAPIFEQRSLYYVIGQNIGGTNQDDDLVTFYPLAAKDNADDTKKHLVSKKVAFIFEIGSNFWKKTRNSLESVMNGSPVISSNSNYALFNFRRKQGAALALPQSEPKISTG